MSTRPDAPGPDSAPLNTRRLNELGLGFMQAGTLIGAIELGLFDALAGGAHAIDEIAAALGLPARRVEKLVTACAALALVERDGDRARNAPDVERFLVRGKPTWFGDYLVHTAKGAIAGFGSVAEQLRSTREGRRYYDFTADPAAARSLTVAGYTGSQGTARRLARRFDFSPFRRMLDLGGGSGVYSIEACRANPGLRATVLDHANVCAVTREFVEKAGLADRIDTHPGDFTRDALPPGADLVLLCGNLHAYDSDVARRVIRKAFDVLPSGGGMILIDYMLDAARCGPPVPAFLSLSLEFGGAGGKVHDEREFRAYLEDAGFRVERVEEFLEGSLGWATARKP
jgi:hypothetical protein